MGGLGRPDGALRPSSRRADAMNLENMYQGCFDGVCSYDPWK
jgi:hypothetical protein